jgi:hypothetical protein
MLLVCFATQDLPNFISGEFDWLWLPNYHTLLHLPHGTLFPSATHNDWPLVGTLHSIKGTLKGTQVLVGHITVLAQHNQSIIT